MSARRRSAPTLAAGITAVVLAALALAGQALAVEAADAAYVRVDQVGYVTSAHKRAFLLAGGSAAGAVFSVRNASGAAVYSAAIGPRTGSWSARFPNVYRLDFDAVTVPGTYTIAVTGPARATSPPFRIGTPSELFAPMIADAPDAFAALATPQDQGECSPAVRAGERLVPRATYRSLDGPRFVVWTRSRAGGWSFWRQSPRLAPAAGLRRASWALPAVPRGVTALSVGLSLAGSGHLAADDMALERGA
jgi:hypothetical protein